MPPRDLALSVASPAPMRCALLCFGLGLAAGCSSGSVSPGGSGNAPSSAATTSSGTGGSGGATPAGWYSDAGLDATALPIIPKGCVPELDVGLPSSLTQYVCPADGGQVQNCGAPAAMDPNLYICPADFCTPGCADLPCPSVPCPGNTAALWTCGPGMPDLDPGCVVVATRPAPAPGVGKRYSACCPF